MDGVKVMISGHKQLVEECDDVGGPSHLVSKHPLSGDAERHSPSSRDENLESAPEYNRKDTAPAATRHGNGRAQAQAGTGAGVRQRMRGLTTSIGRRYFVTSIDESTGLPFPITDEIKRYHTKQSRRLPNWVWYILITLLGIKQHPSDRPWFGTVLYILTIISALTFAVSNFWYIVYDVMSIYTAATVLDGLLISIIGLSWSSLTVYSNRLSYSLLHHSKVVDSVRLHAKSIFKINAAIVVSILAIAFIAINLYQVNYTLQDHHCQAVDLPPFVCKMMFISRVTFSVFGLMWNLLVSTILLSLCRTHTVGLRRFIRDLEIDGRLIEWQHCQRYAKSNVQDLSGVMRHLQGPLDNDSDNEDSVDKFHWNDPLLDSLLSRRMSLVQKAVQQNSIAVASTSSNRNHLADQNELQSVTEAGQPYYISSNVDASESFASGAVHDITPCDEAGSETTSVGDGGGGGGEETGRDMAGEAIMPTDEIMICYWKLAQRLRVTALALQRWLASWIQLILVWTSVYLIYWLNHRASLFDLCQFIVPLLLLPMVCSSFAEVNMEGSRVSKSLCPRKERKVVLVFMAQSPLEMTIYGFPVTYSAITQVFVAMALAVASRVIFNMVGFTAGDGSATTTTTAVVANTTTPATVTLPS